MTRIIDINDPNTYPSDIVEALSLANNNVNYDELFSKYYFKCCHVSCTNNINNYRKYGIMRPFVVTADGTTKINSTLKNIILETFIGDIKYHEYSTKYDEQLINEYERNKNIVGICDWYGKYSCIYYILGKIDISSPAYEPIVNLYGGEILRDIGISEKVLEELGRKCKTYLIYFKLSYFEVKEKCIYFPDVIEYMKKNYNNEKSNCRFENNINKDIFPSDIIEICEVNK